MVGDIGGAQAQVMSAAERQIATRVDCKVTDVREALWSDRSLVKTWLMRGTLHLARSEDLPFYVGAMGRHWISQMRPSWLEYMQITEEEFWRICDQIGEALNGVPLTREELIASVGDGKSQRVRELLKSGWGGMLKPAARNGLLCFGPNRGQSVTFVRPSKWLRSWRDVSPETAITEMARRYLRAYGPAAKSDFARWWGAWPGVAKAAWSGLASELVPVAVDGARYQLLASDLAAIKRATLERHVTMLAGFDPYLMGHSNRDHLFDAAHAARVSRTAGWISAVVLLDGRVVATWTHTQSSQTLRIKVEPFHRLKPPVVSEIKQRAGELGESIGATKLEVNLA